MPTPRVMTALQFKAYRQPWSNDSESLTPPFDTLPSGEVVGLSINK